MTGTPAGAPKPSAPDDWLGAIVPLGLARETTWRPVGAGVLLIDPPLVWLAAPRSLLEQLPPDRNLAAFVSEQQGGIVLDLITGRRGTPIDWIRHETLDLAVCLFPVNPAWGIKAFPESRCVEPERLMAGLPVLTVASAYGSELGLRPAPLVLPGMLARRDATTLVTTLPLLPQNVGAPVLVPVSGSDGGGVALVGILVRPIQVPPHPLGSHLTLTQGIPVTEALGLIRSEAGRAQRRIAIEQSRAEEATGPS